MININYFYKEFPNGSHLLSELENNNMHILERSKYKHFIKMLDSFIFLFSDDESNTVNNVTHETIILLYSEGFKRIRSSSLLAIKGYYIDSNALLRSVFELNKAINAIQKGIISIDEYFSAERDESFKSLSDKEKLNLVNKHIRNVDSIINNYDDKDVPPHLKDSLSSFKAGFHFSVHKSLENIALYLKDFLSKKDVDLFKPHSNFLYYESYINNVSFLILIYLKNFVKSKIVSLNNISKINNIIDFIENAYISMDEQYHKDIIDYIKIKFN